LKKIPQRNPQVATFLYPQTHPQLAIAKNPTIYAARNPQLCAALLEIVNFKNQQSNNRAF